MPRPGPRPYECVRRAWHSSRHQPIRGSIIQQIFRVVYENHCPATRKNKEWQDKLPIVVLKAEEILYSKANSEAEYSNLETLWDRVNDAINTIIRRDKSSEKGGLLPPCIEAALNLGCVPVRASRSQLQNNPLSYLNLKVNEYVSHPPIVFNKASNVWHQQLSLHRENLLNSERATSAQNTKCSLSESKNYHSQDSNIVALHGIPLLYENIPPGSNDLMTNRSSELNFGLVCPLHYGDSCLTDESQLVSEVQENTNSKTIYVGKPVQALVPEPFEVGVLQNFFPCSTTENFFFKRISQEENNVDENRNGVLCDLSLRLGLSADSCTSAQSSNAQENEDIHSRHCQSRGKLSDFPQKNIDFYSSKGSFKGEDLNLGVTIRKRKELFSDNVNDWRLHCAAKLA